MTYNILAASTSVELVALVQAAIADGWQPLGGVSVTLSESDDFRYVMYAQAVVKP